MTLLLGSLTMGLILALLAAGVLISFRILSFRDLTVDGSLALGGAVTAAMVASGRSPWVATICGALAGGAAGACTGLLATRLKVNPLLAGILVMTALYSVNLRVMGKSNIPLMDKPTVLTAVQNLSGVDDHVQLGLWSVPSQDLWTLIFIAVFVSAVIAGLVMYFRTQLGLAMRATGDNPDMIRALGVDVGWMTTLGLALSNSLIGLSGAFLVQYQGFADVQMGLGMVVWGVASVILGESLVGSRAVGFLMAGAVMGSVLFRLLVAIALRWGLNPNDLKLVTAVFVLIALTLPDAVAALKPRRRAQG